MKLEVTLGGIGVREKAIKGAIKLGKMTAHSSIGADPTKFPKAKNPNNMNRGMHFVSGFAILALIALACVNKTYSPAEMEFQSQYLPIFHSIVRTDTLEFLTHSGRKHIFLILPADSIVQNKDGGILMSSKPIKSLSAEIRQLGEDTVPLLRKNVVWVETLPMTKNVGFNLQLNDFIFYDTNALVQTIDSLNFSPASDSLFVLHSNIHPSRKESITVVYVTLVEGIVAFKTSDGATWMRLGYSQKRD